MNRIHDLRGFLSEAISASYFRLFFLLISLSLFCCNDKVSVEKPLNKKENNPQTTEQASYFSVKNVGDVKSKNEFVDFTWTENGKEVKLSDFKGKVILINFWATWCGPCRSEIPSLSKLSEELKDKEFKMVGVSVDQNENALSNFMKSNKLSYTIVLETSSLVSKYMQVGGNSEDVIPQTYIIDKNGKVVETIIGSRPKEEFLQLINKYL